jgi:hypothetical protein
MTISCALTKPAAKKPNAFLAPDAVHVCQRLGNHLTRDQPPKRMTLGQDRQGMQNILIEAVKYFCILCTSSADKEG